MAITRVLLLVTFLTGACGSGTKVGPTTESAKAPSMVTPGAGTTVAPLDLAVVRKEVSAWVDKMWRAYVTADMATYQPTIGKNLFTWSTSAKVSLGYDASLKDTASDFASFRKLAKAGAELTYTEVGRDIGVSEDGAVAWVVTEKEALLTHQGKKNHLAIVSTGVMVRDSDGHWKKVHSHSGARLPLFAIASMVKHKVLPAPASIENHMGAGADAVATRFRETVADMKTFATTVSDDPHTQFAFGHAGTYLAGGAEVKRALVGLANTGVRMTIKQLRAAIVAPGVGWVSANVDSSFSKVTAPMRMSVVYRLAAGEWNAVQIHMSFGHGSRPPFTAGASEVACAEEANLRSNKSGKQTLLRFRNLSGQDVVVHWLDDTGKRKKMLTLRSGGEAMHQTWVSYPFLFADPAGNCLSIYFGQPRPTSAVYLGKP